MENTKENTKDSSGVGEKQPIQGNAPNQETQLESDPNPPSLQPSRTPFTSLSQEEADLALARTLQEQERAYMLLRMNGEYDSSESGSYVDEDEEEGDPNDDENDDGGEDAFDVHAHAVDDEDELGVRVDPGAFDSDEAYARALQDAEEQVAAAHLMALAGIHDWEAEDPDDHGSNSQDTWQEVDPDELSYEELLALGEVVGTESRGLSADIIASLPSINYKTQSASDGNTDQCVICRLDYEDGETLILLKCKHAYHSECINNWLQINKVCPVCSAEVSTSGDRQGT